MRGARDRQIAVFRQALRILISDCAWSGRAVVSISAIPLAMNKSEQIKLGLANILLFAFACQQGSCKTGLMMQDNHLESMPAELDPRPPEAGAGAFGGGREGRRGEWAEDFVELIAEFIHAKGGARPVDIATKM